MIVCAERRNELTSSLVDFSVEEVTLLQEQRWSTNPDLRFFASSHSTKVGQVSFTEARSESKPNAHSAASPTECADLSPHDNSIRTSSLTHW